MRKHATLLSCLQSFLNNNPQGSFRVTQITTILLLACFLVFQYGRQISYWECRFSNTFKTSSEKCDCGQMVNDITDQSDSNPIPVHHKHLHLDDTFCPPFIAVLKETYLLLQVKSGIMLPVYITLNLPSRLDKPPQVV